jgi:hypothetical protein
MCCVVLYIGLFWCAVLCYLDVLCLACMNMCGADADEHVTGLLCCVICIVL